MQSILIVIQLLVSIGLVIVVLLQKSEGGALGMGGSGGGLGGFMSARGAGDALTRTTAVLAVVFFATSLALTILALHGRPAQESILDSAPLSVNHALVPPKPAQQPVHPQGPAVPTPH
jgi:preprotein translocase subunit SecG